LLGLYAVAAGAAALISASLWPQGWGVITRPALGLAGLAGGLLLLCGDPSWRALLRLWAFAQAAVFVVDPSGELTRQPFLRLAYSSISSTTSNDQVIDAQGYGINLAGVGLLVLTQWIISRKWYMDVPIYRWQFVGLRVVRSVFLSVVLAAGGYLGWLWAPSLLAKEQLLVITSPLPGTEVFAKDRRLGWTPLVLTTPKLVEWGLSRPEGPARCHLRRAPLDNGYLLTGNKAATTLLLKPPWWCEGQFLTFESEWGRRGVPMSERHSSNRCEVLLVAKSQAGLVLSLPQGIPKTVSPGQALEFPVVLRRNPPDPRVRVLPPTKPPLKALIVVTYALGTAYPSKQFELPDSWREPGVGAELSQLVKVAAPDKPGKYEVRVHYSLHGGASGQERLDYGTARCFGFVEVRPSSP
jgi:hypothetical protein